MSGPSATAESQSLPKAEANVVDLRGVNAKQIRELNDRHKGAVAEKEFLERLLRIEAGLRSVNTLQELTYFAVNELRSIIQCNQILLMWPGFKRSYFVINAVSNLAEPDPYSPVIQWLTKEINAQIDFAAAENPDELAKSFKLKTDAAKFSGFVASNGILVPLKDRSENIFAFLVFLSEKPFAEPSRQLALRLGAAVSSSWLSFEKVGSLRAFKMPRAAKILMAMALLVAAFIPVPLMVLAPVKIIADQAELVSSPLVGVIEKIEVLPNAAVPQGAILFSLEKTDAINLMNQAEQKLAIAEAKLLRANQDAFSTANGRKDIAVAKAEFDLAIAEKEAASRKLALTEVRASKAGIVLFESKEKWTGRPVSIGERVMKIADPTRVKLQMDLPTEEAIILSEMKQARVFLDADPLNPFVVEIDHASYEAQMSDANILSFPIYANRPDEPPKTDLRIGLRGTAQLSGEKVPLWFFLFRKPLSFLRQWTGI